MNDLHICLLITREHPETVDYNHVLLTCDDVEEGESTMAIVEAREARWLTKLTGGLDLLQLNPKDSDGKPKLSGMDLFQHMCYY